MKVLYFARHAKSSWKDLSLDDFDRPLNKRGERDAPMMAAKINAMGIKPDRLLSSPALRAKRTAQAFAKAFGTSKERIRYSKRIYDADLADLLEIIHALPEEASSVMLFGHNPEFTWLVNKLAGVQFDNVPTAGVVGIAFSTEDWKEVAYGKGRLQFFIYPKQFK